MGKTNDQAEGARAPRSEMPKEGVCSLTSVRPASRRRGTRALLRTHPHRTHQPSIQSTDPVLLGLSLEVNLKARRFGASDGLAGDGRARNCDPRPGKVNPLGVAIHGTAHRGSAVHAPPRQGKSQGEARRGWPWLPTSGQCKLLQGKVNHKARPVVANPGEAWQVPAGQ